MDNQGCPVKEKQIVDIQKDRIEIKDKVYFDTGKAKIQRRSFKLLDQVAKVILEHPELEKVWIEGHTDERASRTSTTMLSQRRAEAVREYLIKKGVAPQRLEAKGYGPQRAGCAEHHGARAGRPTAGSNSSPRLARARSSKRGGRRHMKNALRENLLRAALLAVTHVRAARPGR